MTYMCHMRQKEDTQKVRETRPFFFLHHLQARKEKKKTSMEDEAVETSNTHVQDERDGTILKGRKVSWTSLRRIDSLNLEAGRISMRLSQRRKLNWMETLCLAFQSIGVVYGDIGTSPLYVYASTFHDGIHDNEDIIGVLSLIIYTILLVPMIKYVFIVLQANDNGDGGTFALYSLLCRYAKVSLIPKDQPEDKQLSNYRLDLPSKQLKRAQRIKEKLEKNKSIQILLFLVTVLGTSMVIGDGVLTPCISVLSAVSGINSLGRDAIVGVSVAILIVIFFFQRFGTDKVGFTFAPIILLWFCFITCIGLYNLFKYDVRVLRASNPQYLVEYFNRNGEKAWISLGGVVLCITGAEAMFADLGHFSVRAIQISFSVIVFPALLTAYCGQAAYLSKFPGDVLDTFYKSIPDSVYWPTFVIAVAAAIVASQAMISAVFSIISQSLTLGCFPRVKVIHTSSKFEGQVYIPEVNYMLMIACVVVCLVFKTTEQIGNAYGIAVVAVMVITTGMVTLVMLVVWKTNIWWIILFFVGFSFMECVYLSSTLYKFKQGGFLPLAFSFFLMVIMSIWHYVHKKRYMYELDHKVGGAFIRELALNPNLNRVPGMGLLFSELVQGIPPIFRHFVSNISSLHSVLVFVSIKSVPISKVAVEERFLFRQVEPKENHMFRCVVRYGYNDATEEPHEFEHQLVRRLKDFIRDEHRIAIASETEPETDQHHSSVAVESRQFLNSPRVSSSSSPSFNQVQSANGIDDSLVPRDAEEETQFVQKAMEKSVVYLLGQTEVVAEANSSFMKKIIVNYAYNLLRKNFRQGDSIVAIPQTRLLRVGMTYEL